MQTFKYLRIINSTFKTGINTTIKKCLNVKSRPATREINYKNVKIKIEDQSDTVPIHELNQNVNELPVTRWTKNYTFPEDKLVKSYKLKEGEQTYWRRLPDQQMVPWYYSPLKLFFIIFFGFTLVHNYDQILKSLNNQYIYDHKATLK